MITRQGRYLGDRKEGGHRGLCLSLPLRERLHFFLAFPDLVIGNHEHSSLTVVLEAVRKQDITNSTEEGGFLQLKRWNLLPASIQSSSAELERRLVSNK